MATRDYSAVNLRKIVVQSQFAMRPARRRAVIDIFNSNRARDYLLS